MPTADDRALQSNLRQMQRLFGKKIMEAKILRRALKRADGQKNISCELLAPGTKAVCETLGVARSIGQSATIRGAIALSILDGTARENSPWRLEHRSPDPGTPDDSALGVVGIT